MGVVTLFAFMGFGVLFANVAIGEESGWIGVALAVVAMVRGEWAAYNARAAKRDLLAFDNEMYGMKTEHAHCKQNMETMRAELAECQKQHEASKDEHIKSEVDRAALRAELVLLKNLIQSNKKPLKE